MANLFNSVNMRKVRRNQFNMSYDHKLSCKFGQLVPVHVQEVVPGDTFIHNSAALVRFAPLMAPIMHRVNVYIHYFYVPNRILWKKWENFITGNEDVTFPYITVGGSRPINNGSLGDYLGMPSSGR